MKKILFSFIFTILAFGFFAGIAYADGCSKFGGVTGVCDSLSANRGADWSVETSPLEDCGFLKSCWIQKGDALCKAIRITYTCNESASCDPSSETAVRGNCAGTKVCCLTKLTNLNDTTSGGTTGIPAVKPVTTDMVKHESPTGALKNPFAGKTVPTLIGSLIKGISGLAGSLFFLYLLWGGVEWMMARGGKGKVEEARNRIVHAVLGILIVIGSYMAVSAIIGFTSTF